MTETTLRMIHGSVTLTDLDTGFVRIDTLPYLGKQCVLLGEPEIRTLITSLRHHAQSRKRPHASAAPTTDTPLEVGGESTP